MYATNVFHIKYKTLQGKTKTAIAVETKSAEELLT